MIDMPVDATIVPLTIVYTVGDAEMAVSYRDIRCCAERRRRLVEEVGGGVEQKKEGRGVRMFLELRRRDWYFWYVL